MSDMRCWQCGVGPIEVIDVSTISELPGSSLMPGHWPAGDHTHEVTPPTPGQLIERGSRISDRIVANWG